MTTHAEGSGRVALITGATRGIARGIALDLARTVETEQSRLLAELVARLQALKRDGVVVEACTPDFYLPELGTYIECTVMKQANTNKKNQKVRKLREQYGEVVTILYRRDFQRLRRKYRSTSSATSNPIPQSSE